MNASISNGLYSQMRAHILSAVVQCWLRQREASGALQALCRETGQVVTFSWGLECLDGGWVTGGRCVGWECVWCRASGIYALSWSGCAYVNTLMNAPSSVVLSKRHRSAVGFYPKKTAHLLSELLRTFLVSLDRWIPSKVLIFCWGSDDAL